MKMTTKMSAILLGIVLGLDASILVQSFWKTGAEIAVILFALITIVLGFWDDVCFQQVARFSSAMIIGIAVREFFQMSMKFCFIISVITLIAIITIISIISVKKRRYNEEPIYDDMSSWLDDDDDYDDEEEYEAETEAKADEQVESKPDESEEK